MGILEDLSQQARIIASKVAVTIENNNTLFLDKETDIRTKFKTQLDILIKNFGTDAYDTTAVDSVHTDSIEFITEVRDATTAIKTQMNSVNDMVTRLQTVISNVQNSTDFNALDASSKQLLLDFSKDYKISYTIMWAKIVLVAFLLYYLRQEWIFILVVYAAIHIIWKVIVALIGIFKVITQKRTKSTDLPATGEKSCNIPKQTYIPCSETAFGCCGNGFAALGDATTCGTLDCWKSAFGCCSDGITSKKTADDTCNVSVDCTTSAFGCCPNGMQRFDAAGSNCKMNSKCGYSEYGCCKDGTLRADSLGSNCTEYKPTISKLLSNSAVSLPNPFTGSGDSGLASGLRSIF